MNIEIIIICSLLGASGVMGFIEGLDKANALSAIFGLLLVCLSFFLIFNDATDYCDVCKEFGYETRELSYNIEPGYVNCSQNIYENHIKVGKKSKIFKLKDNEEIE